ncbi:hypothetical protein ACH42_14135 [Endozoicomonas sp. (ex Bugula neritina AB1)]|nr:hypothetical protein ACH42_14135 [Endozoicomonas sp. (ex Bugula neritina AB1)]
MPLHQWLPPTPPSAVIHISHGMGEYAQRYASLSSYLNNAGFIVYAHDHRGHGMNIDKGIKGHFSHKNGWNLAVDDTTHVLEHIRDEHRELPCFLLGHSMGSYLIQSHLIKNNLSKNAPKFQGMILSGSNYAPQLLMWFARVIAKIETLRQGKIGHSKLIDLLTFSDFNRSFKPQRTDFDWLSRDHQQVNAYVNDPLCGFPCTNQLWLDLFTGLQSICSVKTLEQLPRDLPVLIMGGADDPVSAPKGQQKLAAAYEQAGVKEVTTHIYPQGRHEMFNEINREQVIERLIQWMNNHLTE